MINQQHGGILFILLIFSLLLGLLLTSSQLNLVLHEKIHNHYQQQQQQFVLADSLLRRIETKLANAAAIKQQCIDNFSSTQDRICQQTIEEFDIRYRCQRQSFSNNQHLFYHIRIEVGRQRIMAIEAVTDTKHRLHWHTDSMRKLIIV